MRADRTGGKNHVEEGGSSGFEDPAFPILSSYLSHFLHRPFAILIFERSQQAFPASEMGLSERCCAFDEGVCSFDHLWGLRHSVASRHEYRLRWSCKVVDHLLLLKFEHVCCSGHCFLVAATAFFWKLLALQQETVVAQECWMPHRTKKINLSIRTTVHFHKTKRSQMSNILLVTASDGFL